MSKRVMIILAVGFLAIVAGIFLHGYEVKNHTPGPEPEEEEEEEETETKENEKEEPAAVGTNNGTDTTGAKNE